jgi:phage/plasmid-like protein (TIGR03299 family)
MGATGFTVTLASRKAVWDMAFQDQIADTGTYATATEMLEAAGLKDWNVDKKPIYVGRKGAQIPRKFATVRADGTPLGIVGPGYKVLQMEEAFGFGDNIVDSGDAKWERAGSLRGGALVFGCMEFAHLGITVPGDEADGQMKPYLLMVNSFDGGSPFQGIITFVHPRCTNTFEMAVSGGHSRFRIRHTGTLEGKIQMAREALGITFGHVQEATEYISRLALKHLVDDQVEAIFKEVWPISETATEAHVEEAAATKAFELYNTSPTVAPIIGTAWGAFNAVTEYIDHVADYKEGRTNSLADVKTNSILFGTAGSRKERALKALLAV